MSITINGATNTLTAASGLTIAGNTAVTGTLSSTGSMSVVPTTGTNPAWLFFKNDSGVANSYIGQDGSVAGLDTAYSLNVWNGSNTPIIFGVNNAKVGSWTSTGLAVTGTLSATGAIGLTTATGVAAATLTCTTGTESPYLAMVNTGGTYYIGVDNSVGGSFSSTAYDLATYLPAAKGATTLIGGAVVSRLTSTALTLGSGVNLVKDATTAILADTTDGYLIYGSSTTGTTGSTLVLFGEASAAPNEAHVRVNNTTKMTVATSAVTLAAGVNLVMAQSYIEGAEMTAPAAPAANGFRIFAEDNGAGKTRLMVQFATGAAQQIAIEP